MQVKFLKDIQASEDGINLKQFNAGDIVEIKDWLAKSLMTINVLIPYSETKSLNPVIENKAITNLVNKAVSFVSKKQEKKLEDCSVEELQEILTKKGISFHHRAGLNKLKQLLKDNK